VFAVEALLAAAAVLAVRSEAGSAQLLGYSYARLGLAGLLLGAAMLLAGLGMLACRSRLDGLLARLENRRSDPVAAGWVFYGLLFVTLFLARAFVFTWLFVPAPLRAPLAWAALVGGQLLVALRRGGLKRPRPRLPSPRTLDPGQRRVLRLLALVGLVYFGAFIIPNLRGAETPHELLVRGQDEPVIYPILVQMLTPGETFTQTLYHSVIYEDYHYGYPFYVVSALVSLPARLILGDDFAAATQLNLLVLRQLVSVLPLTLAALLLVYLVTRFRSAGYSLGLFAFLLLVPGVVQYNIRFWHPDGLAVLCVVLTLFFLDRDRLRLGVNFYAAAFFCGLASAIRLVGFFAFLAVAGVLIAALVTRRATFRQAVLAGAGFLAVMALTIVLTNPFVFLGSARARLGEILAEKSHEMTYGYDEPDPENIYRTGLDVWLPFIARSYARPFFLLFGLVSLLAGWWFGREKLANGLILAWFVPALGYLILFVAVKSFQYMLPPMLPFLAGALNLPMMVSQGDLMADRPRWQRRAFWGVCVLGVVLQALFYLPEVAFVWQSGLVP
jgi:hypothetical protein